MTSHVFARPAGDEVRICGIVNVTPDSFSDGGEHLDGGGRRARVDARRRGCAHARHRRRVDQAGAVAPTVAEELRRVVPVITELARRTTVPISIDTSRPRVMQAAFDAGARFLNDVRAFRHRARLLSRQS
ncbi:dihydropteroate synthase [Rhodococcus sp. P1Y]|uniref:dihydropteroate synthase n=1 Tax=Rhodococcus sp. P1Y TaxID=1302308 RepID=UPI001F3D01B2|nr:dihydropteroate synthase [Rhodococcus sp. P1Y]